MIPTKQTTPYNCLAACIASILEIPLERVPQWNGQMEWEDYTTILQNWLETLYGMEFCCTAIWREDDLSASPKGYAILGVKRPSGVHCVVTYDGVIEWDPGRGDPVFEYDREDIEDWTVFRTILTRGD